MEVSRGHRQDNQQKRRGLFRTTAIIGSVLSVIVAFVWWLANVVLTQQKIQEVNHFVASAAIPAAPVGPPPSTFKGRKEWKMKHFRRWVVAFAKTLSSEQVERMVKGGGIAYSSLTDRQKELLKRALWVRFEGDLRDVDFDTLKVLVTRTHIELRYCHAQPGEWQGKEVTEILG